MLFMCASAFILFSLSLAFSSLSDLWPDCPYASEDDLEAVMVHFETDVFPSQDINPYTAFVRSEDMLRDCLAKFPRNPFISLYVALSILSTTEMGESRWNAIFFNFNNAINGEYRLSESYFWRGLSYLLSEDYESALHDSIHLKEHTSDNRYYFLLHTLAITRLQHYSANHIHETLQDDWSLAKELFYETETHYPRMLCLLLTKALWWYDEGALHDNSLAVGLNGPCAQFDDLKSFYVRSQEKELEELIEMYYYDTMSGDEQDDSTTSTTNNIDEL